MTLPKHDWCTVNRDRLGPEDLNLNDLFEEIRAAVPDDETVIALAIMLDEGRYNAFGAKIGAMMRAKANAPRE